VINPRQIFDHLQRNPEGLARVRLGRGVVGNTTYGFVGLCSAGILIVWALNKNPGYAFASLIALIFVYLLYLFGTYKFADKNPETAMLGDSEWLQLKNKQMAAKGINEFPEGPVIEAPTHPKVELDENE
jgi:hypothetical protein